MLFRSLVFDKANASYTNANAAYDKANSANVLAYNTGIGANNYAGAMANSGNAWTQTIVDANLVTARAYTNTSTASANDWSNTKVSAVSSNSTSRIWANTVVVGSTQNVYLDLATTGVTATTYGGTSNAAAIVVDAYGRVTSASNVAIPPSTNVGNVVPSTPQVGALWWNADYGRLLIY